MTKPKIILLIVILVVVNISTYCGYGKMRRGNRHKENIYLSEVDSIKIQKLTLAPDSLSYSWKRLSFEQEQTFAGYWNETRAVMSYKPIPAYRIRVYFKNKAQRNLKALYSHIQEGRFVYYNNSITKDYFEKLYASAN